MGRTRRASPRRVGAGGRLLKHWPAIFVLALACSPITGDFDRVVSIEYVGTTSPSLEEGDTLRLHARAISAKGEIVEDAEIHWAVLDTGEVGFTIGAESGLISAYAPASGRVQASVENLRTGAITVTVGPAADSMAAVGDVRVTVDTGAVSSTPLTVVILDLTTTPGDTLALGGKGVHFLTVNPPPGDPALGSFFITAQGTEPGDDPHRVDLTTATSGQAAITAVRVSGETQPDSVAVDATSVTAAGETVAGSPVRFWVLFQNN